VTAYIGKLLIHPVPVASLQEFWMRAAIGPFPVNSSFWQDWHSTQHG
jgi:hypothetical protein